MIISRAMHERHYPAAVCVANQRGLPIRPQTGALVLNHRLQFVPVSFRHLDFIDTAEHEGEQKQFGLQTMIARRCFVVGTVGEHLLVHLAQQLAQAKLPPFIRRL